MELLQQLSANNSSSAVTSANAVGATDALGANGVVARPRRRPHAGADQRPPARRLRRRDPGRAGRRTSPPIPFSAIERVEVLKDGASAIYGSDAIARRDQLHHAQRLHAAPKSPASTVRRRAAAAASSGRAAASAGFGDLAKDRWNVFFSAHLQRAEVARPGGPQFLEHVVSCPISASSASPATRSRAASRPAASASSTTAAASPVLAANPADCVRRHVLQRRHPRHRLLLRSVGDARRQHDPARQDVQLLRQRAVPDQQRLAGLRAGRSTRATKTHLVIQPGPVSSLFTYGPRQRHPRDDHAAADEPVLSASARRGRGRRRRSRSTSATGRSTTAFATRPTPTSTGRSSRGVKGTLGELGLGRSLSTREGKTTAAPERRLPGLPRLLPLLNSGTRQPVRHRTRPTIVSAAARHELHRRRVPRHVEELRRAGQDVRRNLEAAGGSARAGLRRRGAQGKARPDMADALSGGNITGYGGDDQATVGADRKQWAVFARVQRPDRQDARRQRRGPLRPLQRFRQHDEPEVQPALAADAHGAGARLVRHGLPRAERCTSCFTPQFGGVSQPGLTDPIRCPVTNDTGLDCNTQFDVLFGGNPQPQARRSRSRRRSASCSSRFPALSFSIDYFKINLKNAIQNGISPVDDPRQTWTSSAPSSRAARSIRISRPAGTDHLDRPDVHQPAAPCGSRVSTSKAITARRRQPGAGCRSTCAGTYYLRYDVQQTGRLVLTARSATRYSIVEPQHGVIPRWKHYASMTWDQGPWSATLAQTYQTSYTDCRSTDLDGNLRADGGHR